MKITRRILAVLILAAPVVLVALAGSAKPPAPPHSYLVLVGTYTHKTASKGIYAFSYDTDTGKLTPKGVAAETADPSFVAIHPNGKYAYAVNETGKQSAVSAFTLDAQTCKLTLRNQLPALGEDPCYISFDKTGKFVLIANYTSGNVAVFPILPDGSLVNIPRRSRTLELSARTRSARKVRTHTGSNYPREIVTPMWPTSGSTAC